MPATDLAARIGTAVRRTPMSLARTAAGVQCISESVSPLCPTINWKGSIDRLSDVAWPTNPCPDITTLLLHGSQADGTAGAFADVDLALILWTSTVTDEQSRALSSFMLELARRSLTIDPLQHHLPQLVYGGDGLAWDDFPPIFAEPVAHISGVKPDGDPRRVAAVDTASARENLHRFAATLWPLARVATRSAFDAKSFLSTVLLLPALAHQAAGNPVSKAESFTCPAAVLPEPIASAVEMASAARAEWSFAGRRRTRAARAVLPWTQGMTAARRAHLNLTAGRASKLVAELARFWRDIEGDPGW